MICTFSKYSFNAPRDWTVIHEHSLNKKVYCFFLTLSWRRLSPYRNHSIDLLCKSVDWFLYDNGLRHERVKSHFNVPPIFDIWIEARPRKFVTKKIYLSIILLYRFAGLNVIFFKTQTECSVETMLCSTWRNSDRTSDKTSFWKKIKNSCTLINIKLRTPCNVSNISVQ